MRWSLRRFVVFLFVFTALALPGRAAAQDEPYMQIVDGFFDLMRKGETDRAVDFVYGSNPWIAQSRDAVQQVRTQLGGLSGIVGQLRSHERLQKKVLGTRFVYLSYLVAYDRQPMRFVFEFYKPDQEWITFSFSFDQDLDDDLEAMAREELGRTP